jgi:hypothetical protein
MMLQVDKKIYTLLERSIKNLVHTTRFWNNHHQIRSKEKVWKAE